MLIARKLATISSREYTVVLDPLGTEQVEYALLQGHSSNSSSNGGRICPHLCLTSQFCCAPARGRGGVWTDLGRGCRVLTRHSSTMRLSLLELRPGLVQKAWLFYWLWTVRQLGRVSKRSQEELVKIRWYLKSSCSEHLPGVGCPGLQTEVLQILCVWPQHDYGVAACRIHKFLQFHTPVSFALSTS